MSAPGTPRGAAPALWTELVGTDDQLLELRAQCHRLAEATATLRQVVAESRALPTLFRSTHEAVFQSNGPGISAHPAPPAGPTPARWMCPRCGRPLARLASQVSTDQHGARRQHDDYTCHAGCGCTASISWSGR